MNKLQSLLRRDKTVVAPGVFNPFVAKIAEHLGFKAVYFSGASFSNELSLPDLGVITMTEVYNEVSRITMRLNYLLLWILIPGMVKSLTFRGQYCR